MTDFRPLPNGWRTSEPYSEEKNAAYRKSIVEEMYANGHPPPKVIPTFKNEEEKQAHIFAMQQPSTKAALEAQKTRHSSEDIDHLLRPMPACIANPDAKDKDDLVGVRILTHEEMEIETRRRRSSKNTLGESKAGSLDARARDRGIEAFTYSRPATLTEDEIKKLSKMQEIEAISPEFSPKEEEIPQKEGLLSRAVGWIQEHLPQWVWK